MTRNDDCGMLQTPHFPSPYPKPEDKGEGIFG